VAILVRNSINSPYYNGGTATLDYSIADQMMAANRAAMGFSATSPSAGVAWGSTLGSDYVNYDAVKVSELGGSASDYLRAYNQAERNYNYDMGISQVYKSYNTAALGYAINDAYALSGSPIEFAPSRNSLLGRLPISPLSGTTYYGTQRTETAYNRMGEAFTYGGVGNPSPQYSRSGKGNLLGAPTQFDRIMEDQRETRQATNIQATQSLQYLSRYGYDPRTPGSTIYSNPYLAAAPSNSFQSTMNRVASGSATRYDYTRLGFDTPSRAPGELDFIMDTSDPSSPFSNTRYDMLGNKTTISRSDPRHTAAAYQDRSPELYDQYTSGAIGGSQLFRRAMSDWVINDRDEIGNSNFNFSAPPTIKFSFNTSGGGSISGTGISFPGLSGKRFW